MVIVIDADDVTYPLKEPYYEYLEKRFDKKLDWKKDHYHLAKELNLTWEEETILYYEFTQTDEYRNIKPFPGAVEGIKRLRKISDLVVITSRPIYLEESTWESFFRDFPKDTFSDIKLGNHYNFKDPNRYDSKGKFEMCREVGAKLIIDDLKKYANKLSQTIPVILYDQPWNQNFEKENVYRAGNWRKGYAKGWKDTVKIIKREKFLSRE